MVKKASVSFAPVGEEEMKEIHRRQAGPDQQDIAEWFDSEPLFKPMTPEELKKKIDAEREKDRTMVAAIMSGNKMVGIATWTSSWDPWTPSFGMLVWTDERRKGYATAAAKALLEKSFDDSLARVVQSFWVNDFNSAGVAFAKSLGFKPQGALRRAGVRNGRFHDTLVFDMLREEYVKLRRGWN